MTRTALITGMSSGVGEATAAKLLQDGWNVVATARREADAARTLDGDKLLRARLDVTDAASIESAFALAAERFGGVDVVVNNAGIGLAGPIEAIELDRLRDHFEVNVIGVAAVCRAAIAQMRARGSGLLINVTSLTGRIGIPFLSPYCAGKFAVEGLTESMYYELRPLGIRVKLVEPGGVRTKFEHPWTVHPAYEPALDAVRLLMARGGERSAPPERVAGVIAAAATDRSDRLRYTATDAGALLRLRRMLPDVALRTVIRRSFGLTL